ncbi:MAG: glycerol kinase GlpK, partial [Parasporobacterium sp.]|nr:glycerol kinase GlpK [Parasporobacterium sp.]
MGKYVLSIDQSTQGTKCILFDETGRPAFKTYRTHEQIINEKGWISHDADEIYRNVNACVKEVYEHVGPEEIICVGISNQRETSVCWDRNTGLPLAHAVVWQCRRAADICTSLQTDENEKYIEDKTGIKLSPYFPAGKIAWMLRNIPEADKLAEEGALCFGTMDSYLVYRLTGGKRYCTDYTNASRTQLFDIHELKWDEPICKMFGIDSELLPEVIESDGDFGDTDFEGSLPHKIPIMCVMGDSHSALFGQGCHEKGMVKATYGTGSSIMMNIGDAPKKSLNGLVTSIGYMVGGRLSYVLEGNINYSGAVITWLKDDMQLIGDADETGMLAEKAVQDDSLYMVPAFSGLGAPYWNDSAKAIISGMDRTTGRNEIVRAGLESIAYQITDVINAMESDSGENVDLVKTDGGPTKNRYLMQFQSNMLDASVCVSETEELSNMGVAYGAGLKAGIYAPDIFTTLGYREFVPCMEKERRNKKLEGWRAAVKK